jgi:hypothetical protein
LFATTQLTTNDATVKPSDQNSDPTQATGEAGKADRDRGRQREDLTRIQLGVEQV